MAVAETAVQLDAAGATAADCTEVNDDPTLAPLHAADTGEMDADFSTTGVAVTAGAEPLTW